MSRRLVSCFHDVVIYIIAVSEHFTHQIKMFGQSEFKIGSETPKIYVLKAKQLLFEDVIMFYYDVIAAVLGQGLASV